MVGVVEKKQLTLDFTPGLCDRFPTVKELVHYKIISSAKKQAYIAAEMQMSPSDLARKLAPSFKDTKRSFSVDDLVQYMDSQNDTDPALWFVERYFSQASKDQIREQIKKLQAQLGE